MTDFTAMERRCRVGCLLACCLWLTDAYAWRVDQLFQSQCTQLEEQLRANQERQRQGFRLRDEASIERAEAALEQLLDDACQAPEPDDVASPMQRRFEQVTRQQKLTPLSKPRQRSRAATAVASDKPRRRRQNETTLSMSSKRLPALQISTLELKAPYSGEKLMAWLGFFREPAQCFGVRDLRQIVRCADARQQARQRFEAWWQQQTTPACRYATAQRKCTGNHRNLSDQ